MNPGAAFGFLAKDVRVLPVVFFHRRFTILVMVDMIYYKGEPLVIEPPMFVELRVADTEPAFKGDTASGGTKPARLETGLTVKVPFHIQTGDLLKIDTRTGEYIEK